MDKNLSILVKFAALDKLTAPLRRMGSGAREAGRDVAGTRREVVALQKTTGKIGALKDLRADAARTAEQLGHARARVAALRAAIEEAGVPTKRLSAQLLVAERDVARFEKTTGSQADRLDDLSRHLREAGVDVGRLAEEEGRLGRAIEDANGRLGEQHEEAAKARAADEAREKVAGIGDKLQAGGVQMLATGAAIAAPLFVGTKAAIGFEAAMADVKKVFNGTPAEFAALNAGVLDLSKRVPVAAEGLAAIAAAGAQSGIEGPANLLAYAESAAKMGVAFGLTADEAGETMSNWRAGLGLTQREVETLADKVNYLGNVSGAKAPAIAEITKRIGPLGAVGGLASGEIAALAATLSSMGVEQEIAATGIKNTILTLTKGTSATKDQKAAFKDLGLTATGVAKSMQRDAAGTITDVLKRIAKLPKAQQSGLLGDLFGSESLGAIAPMLTQLPRLEENLRRVGDASLYTGSMQAEFLGVTDTAASRLQQSANKVEALKVSIGNRLLPIVARAADRFGNLVDRLDAWTAAHPRATQAALVIAGAVALILTTIGSMAIVIGTALGPLSFLVGALKTPAASATLLQRSLQLLFAPLRLIGGIASRGGQLLQLAFSGRWLSLLGEGGSMLLRLGQIFRILLGPIGMIGRVLMFAAGALSALSLPAIIAVAVIIGLFTGLSVFLYNNWAGIAAFFGSVWSSFSAATAPLRASLGALGAALGALGAAFVGWIGRLLGPVIAGIASFAGAVVSFFAPAFRWIGALVGPIALKAWSSFGTIVGGVIGGIVNHLKGLVDWITTGVGWLTRLFNAGAKPAPAVPGAPQKPAPRAAAMPAVAPKLAGKRAAGGPVMGGKLYLVGERGPELFTAPSTGRIIPNHRLGQGLAMAGAASLAALPVAAAPPPPRMPAIATAEPVRVRPDTPLAAPIASRPPAIGSTAPAAGTVVQVTGPITIEVHAPAGADPRTIGEAVAAAFEQRAVGAAAARDSSMADLDE